MLADGPLILVATDFSPTAAAALEWGTEIASSHGGRVCLVHALHLQGPVADYLPSPPDLDEHLQGAAAERLQTLAAELAERGVAATTRLELGLPSQAIVAVAEELDPALLVQGSRGHTGFAHLLLGSTAERVVQHAPCPVLTVHPGDHEEHRPVRTILVPTDFSADAERAAQVARSVLAPVEAGARLVLLHAYHLPVEYTAYGTIPTGLSFQQDVAAVAEERLAEIAGALRRDGLEVTVMSREGYPPEAIVQAAREVGADLVAMGSHGRTGLRHLLLGSTAERVVQHAPCPVLTVRHPDGA
ncbi:MAG TPA: universal stress protein [Thermoanaerobaculia bacterium]|nr:universal stress protein [Thermoanaerobaculia bacterium]